MDLIERVLDLTLAVQQIPAPTFAEHQRADFVRQMFEAEELATVRTVGALVTFLVEKNV